MKYNSKWLDHLKKKRKNTLAKDQTLYREIIETHRNLTYPWFYEFLLQNVQIGAKRSCCMFNDLRWEVILLSALLSELTGDHYNPMYKKLLLTTLIGCLWLVVCLMIWGERSWFVLLVHYQWRYWLSLFTFTFHNSITNYLW
jgi:hypothetical protein